MTTGQLRSQFICYGPLEHHHRSAHQVHDEIRIRLSEFTGDQAASDDSTMIVLKF